jgi:NAD(P)-dependent dehydrogenase (short-subunit alcohol dehydrogenase family)
MIDLAGQRVVILGGSSGIGLAIGSLAATLGAQLILLGRSTSKLAAASARIANAATISLDMRDAPAVAEAIRAIGHVDHLVLTAVADELARKAPLAELSEEQVERSFDKLRGFLNILRQVAPLLPPHGSVTMLTGASAIKPGPGFALLAAESSSIVGLARGVARDLAPVRANVIMAGPVDTPIHKDNREQMKAWAESALPLRRFGQPDDIAHAAVFLMTNRYTTGQTLIVDGGLTL